VHPDTGPKDDIFRFAVRYSGPQPDYVRLNLFCNGVPIAGSPFEMTAGEGDPFHGQVFYLNRKLALEGNWSYRFVAAADGERARGPAAARTDGPSVYHTALSWTGGSGFESDGVHPDSGMRNDTFRFAVRYTGPAPDYVRVRLYCNGQPLPGSPFDLNPGGGDPARGQIFYLNKRLSMPGNWAYQFIASANDNMANGAPTERRQGLTVVAPVLSWAGGSGYGGDGVHPDGGGKDDVFRFAVRYTGPTPEYVRMHLFCNGSPLPGNPFDLTPGNGNPETGQVFYLNRRLSMTGNWAYQFVAAAGGQLASGPPTQRQRGLMVMPPTLDWVGDSAYAWDGVHPNGGDRGGVFRFAVRYRGPAPEYVQLRLYCNGVPIAGGPFDMTPGEGDPASGQVFYLNRRLSLDGLWSYRFVAAGGGETATGPATVLRTGPSVPIPSLRWAGTSGYEVGGVKPDHGGLGETYRFAVRYRGPAPDYVRLRLYCNGQPLPGGPIDMNAGGGDPERGQVFYLNRNLSIPGTWAYQFIASAGGQMATGEPTQRRQGLEVVAPTLAWVGSTGFRSDGVAPNSGSTGQYFNFRVRYTGAEPNYVKLHLYLNGVQIEGSPFRMNAGAGRPMGGQTFYLSQRLTQAGRWSYRFSAAANGRLATGEPAMRSNGPTLSGAAGLMVSSLSCLPTAVGAQVSFTLSAEGTVTAEVLNIAGRPVRMLVSDRALPAGLNTLTWDGRSDAGTRAPGGVYLLRLTACAPDGSQVQSLGMMQLQR
jgi:hypothetical protein